MSSNQIISILKKLGPPLFRYAKKYWKERKQRKQQGQHQQQGGPPPPQQQQHGAWGNNNQQQSGHGAWGGAAAGAGAGGAASAFFGGDHQQGKPDNEANHDNPQFTELRNKAIREGDLMSQAFDNASKAYDSGDGAKAKELSNEGHEHKRLMNEYNDKAADWIFEANNRSRGPGEIDLHGLYVQEAIDRTDTAIGRAKQAGLSEIRIIVGKGNHSKQHVAKIKPAITELMDKHDLDAHLDPHNSGVLVVQLQPSAPHGQRNIGGLADELSNRQDDCVIM